jgi:hypothetical protein
MAACSRCGIEGGVIWGGAAILIVLTILAIGMYKSR